MPTQDDLNEKSYVLIVFDGEGSAHFNIEANKVTPMQMLTISSFLDFEAKFNLELQKRAVLQQMQEREQMSRIVVPKGR